MKSEIQKDLKLEKKWKEQAQLALSPAFRWIVGWFYWLMDRPVPTDDDCLLFLVDCGGSRLYANWLLLPPRVQMFLIKSTKFLITFIQKEVALMKEIISFGKGRLAH